MEPVSPLPQDDAPPPPWIHAALAAALLATALAYVPALRVQFPLDDAYMAKATLPSGEPNPMIAELQPLSRYLRSHMWAGIGRPADPNYRPVAVASYALVYRLFGRASAATPLGEAFPQHLVNVVLHLLAAWLAFRLLAALGAPPLAALLGAVVFALHPLRSEAVISIVGRAELLSFCFGAGATLLALRAAAPGAPRGCGALAGLAFFLAFASKESALAWPAFLFLVLVVRPASQAATSWQARDVAARAARAARVMVRIAGAPTLVFCALWASVVLSLPEPIEPPSQLANPLAHVSAATRMLTATWVQAYALALTVAPFELASDYGFDVFPFVQHALDPRFVGSLALLAALLAGGLMAVRRAPLLFFASASFFGFAFVISNLPLAIGTIFGERLYYTPALALSFVVAWTASWARVQPRPLAIGLSAALGLWLCISALTIAERSRVWSDNESLYTHDARAQPRSSTLNVRAAAEYARRGDRQRQFEHLTRAFALSPDVTRHWLYMAWRYQDAGSTDEAFEAAGRGLEAAEHDPDERALYTFPLQFVRSQVLRESDPRPWPVAFPQARDSLARLLEDPRRLEELRSAVADHPAAVHMWRDLAWELTNHGDLAGTERALTTGLDFAGSAESGLRFDLLWRLVGVLDAQGRREEAQRRLEQALATDRDAFGARLGEVLSLVDRGWDPAWLKSILERGERGRPIRPEWNVYRGLLASRVGGDLPATRSDPALP